MDDEKCNGVIISFAKKLTKDRDLQKDLIQEGYVGLLKAKKNYNPTFGIDFLTYAYPYIKDHISRYYKKNKEQNMIFKELVKYDSDLGLDGVYFDDVDNFLEGCSEDSKKIIHLIVDEDKSYREIAEQLGYSKSKISYILSKDKDKLYKNIKNRGI